MEIKNSKEIETFLDLEFKELSFCQKKFPIFFNSTITDPVIHSAGVSYLLSLGLELKLSAISEYPITIHAKDEWKNFGRIFPDSVWFNPSTNLPWVTIEFERFEKGDEEKITTKVKNLILSYYQSKESIDLIILMYWLRSNNAPKSIEPLIKVFSEGFNQNGKKIPPPKCKFLIYKFVFCESKEKSNSLNIKDNLADYNFSPLNLLLNQVQKIGSFPV
jgi:hypothetical protein